MKIAVISPEKGILGSFLASHGFEVRQYTPEEVPSLTRLVFDNGEIAAIVICDSDASLWSAAHVIAAARRVQLILFGGGKLTEQCAGVKQVLATRELLQLLLLLQKPGKKDTGGDRVLDPEVFKKPAAERKPPEQNSAPVAAPVKIQPMDIPAGQILVLGVVGSQRRIGCTTQAVGLWHYCKALGFDPAIVASAERVAQIAGSMRNEKIEDGYKVEGIPFVTGMALAYDCYILDMGTGVTPQALWNADCVVLVAGSKPWELPQTTAAMQGLERPADGVLLSYTSQKDAAILRPLFGEVKAEPAPWVPVLWQPDPEAMRLYDILLRLALEKVLTATRAVEIAAPEPTPEPMSEQELTQEAMEPETEPETAQEPEREPAVAAPSGEPEEENLWIQGAAEPEPELEMEMPELIKEDFT